MLELLEKLTIVISICFVIYSLKRLDKSTVHILHVIFFIICSVPLILDYIMGMPQYSDAYPLFKDACVDTVTRYWYCLYLLITQCIIIYFSKKLDYSVLITKYHEGEDKRDIYKSPKCFYVLLFFAFFAPLLALLFGMPKEYMITWAWRYDGFDASVINGYGTLERITYISIVAASILFCQKKQLYVKALAVLAVYMNVCIEGKRSALFFALAVFIMCFLMLSKVRNKKLVLTFLGILTLGIIILSSTSIQSDYRGYESTDDMYRMLRIDFFRDDTIKSAIYAMMHPERVTILDYPSQSFIMEIGYLMPLVWMGVPKVGYETYMTAALKYKEITQLTNGVRMTVSMFDCFIANFSYLGFVLGGLFIVKYSKYIDKCGSIVKPIMICGFLLCSMYSLSYICWYFEFWVVALFVIRKVKLV